MNRAQIKAEVAKEIEARRTSTFAAGHRRPQSNTIGAYVLAALRVGGALDKQEPATAKRLRDQLQTG